MKYIEIFEKFESNKLSKVLGYISKNSREKFINELKKISIKFDFPMSELTDSSFSYLGFSESYKLKGKLMKFWFNTESEYIGMTENLDSDIKIGSLLDYRRIPHLTRVSLPIHGNDIIGTIFIEGPTRYLIQSSHDGNSPQSSNWRQYGRYSWQLGGHDHPSLVKVLSDINVELSADEFNIPMENNHQSWKNITEFLSKAEFSLVLDLRSLPKTKRSEISATRDNLKRADQKYGIEKHIDKLSEYDPDHIEQLNVIVPRILGYNKLLFFIYFKGYTNKISELHTILRNGNKSDILLFIKKATLYSIKEHNELIQSISEFKKLSNGSSDIMNIMNSIEILEKLIKKYIYKNIDDMSDVSPMVLKCKLIKSLISNSVFSNNYLFNDAMSYLSSGDPKLGYNTFKSMRTDTLVEINGDICDLIKNVKSLLK